jgi:hypothetical protein
MPDDSRVPPAVPGDSRVLPTVPGDSPVPPPEGRDDSPVVAVVSAGLRYDKAAARLRALLAAGTRIGAVLVAGDEGVLVANRLPGELPVVDQVDADAAAACQLLAVEVRPPGHPLSLLADPVALGAHLRLTGQEAGDAVTACRTLTDHANAVVGLLTAPASPADLGDEPWVMTADGGRLRFAPRARSWQAGRSARCGRSGQVPGAATSMTCSRWTWPPRPRRRPRGRAARAGRCSSRL